MSFKKILQAENVVPSLSICVFFLLFIHSNQYFTQGLEQLMSKIQDSIHIQGNEGHKKCASDTGFYFLLMQLFMNVSTFVGII